MTFRFDASLRLPFDLSEAVKPGVTLVTAGGHPAKVLYVLENVHHCSSVIFKWAAIDVSGRVINWHVSTATTDGTAQLGSAHNLRLYSGSIDLEPTQLEIW